MRASLTPAEQALHYGRRKALYEQLHPETVSVRKRGGPGRGRKRKNESQNATRFAPAFIDDVAKKIGKHRATIAREIARVTNVTVLAEVVGTGLDQGSELDALGQLSAEDQRALAAQAKAGKNVSARALLKQRKREQREQALARKTSIAARQLGVKLYSVIYADPPWRFEPYSRETGMDRAADNHYGTMTVDEICALEVPAAEHCALFLWATPPMLPQALQVIKAWGFQYRSHIVWVKHKPGTGYWARMQHELLLIAVKGDIPAPAPGMQPCSVVEAKAGRHSQKPEDFARIINEMFPTLLKLEMFARRQREGWNVWGNEVVETEAGDRIADAIPEGAP
jgi:N6-adenosine-specific RNA methylase IME4